MRDDPSPASPRNAGECSARKQESLAERTARFWCTVNRLADATESASAVGATSADTVFKREQVTLWRYRPKAPLRPVPPVVIVHGFVGRASITDLAPGRSLVADLTAAGVDVYTIHWGSPSRADRYLGIEDYLEDHLDACISHVTRTQGQAPVLLGVCEGGVFSICYAALEPARLSGLALTITPIDCHADPEAVLTRWVRAFKPSELARLVDSLGGLPGGAIAGAFQSMTPGRTMAKYTSGLADLADDTAGMTTFLRMEAWLRDRPDHPGEAAKQMLIEHYHENRLARGLWSLGGRRIDLAALQLPVLNAWGMRDILVPPRCAAALGALLPNAAYTPCPLDTGHVGVFVSRRARGQLATAMTCWLDGIAGGINLRCQDGNDSRSDGR